LAKENEELFSAEELAEIQEELKETDAMETHAGEENGQEQPEISEAIEPEVSNAELEALKEENQKLKDQLLRNAAELENFKRRMNEEQIRERKYQAQSVVTAVIPAIDNLERAVSIEAEDEAIANFLNGFKMIHGQLIEALANEGVEAIPTEGEAFDPNIHQAVMQEAVEGVESGVVLAELQKGYRLKDRVIRAAMVKVSQ